MPIVLRACEARFERSGLSLTPALSARIERGGSAALEFAGDCAAAIAARMLAGIIKPSHGTIAIGDFDTRLQPVQARRLCAFASLDIAVPPPRGFERELRFRAALWRIDETRARAAAGEILDAFGRDDPFARSLALACFREAPLIVLDRPPAGTARVMRAIVPDAAIVETGIGSAAPLPSPVPRG
jgi:ABC-type Na+ transport system ATPase subunit NatA